MIERKIERGGERKRIERDWGRESYRVKEREREASKSVWENRNVPKTWKEILDNNETRRNQTLER